MHQTSLLTDRNIRSLAGSFVACKFYSVQKGTLWLLHSLTITFVIVSKYNLIFRMKESQAVVQFVIYINGRTLHGGDSHPLLTPELSFNGMDACLERVKFPIEVNALKPGHQK